MRFDDDVKACASLVQRADPDRFMAAMAAPVTVRPALFALYALNVEVARAPWVTGEAMIAEIRLQWWRDALAEIAAGGVVRRHEVVTPLARVIDAAQAETLDDMIAVRYWDINRDPFEDKTEFDRYIDHSAGSLMWVAAQVLGPADEGVVRDFAYAAGFALDLILFAAVRERILLARVPKPLQDTSIGLATAGLFSLAFFAFKGMA